MPQGLFGRFRTQIFFILSGGSAAAFQLLTYLFLSKIMGLWYLLASIISFSLAVIISFLLQKFVTFENKDKESMHRQFLLFFTLAFLNLGANIFLMLFLTEKIRLLDIISQIITMGIIAIWSFLAYRYFIFRETL